ncbi:hypothetical protein B0A48_15106 [Cryoendolithus antarcticus]|uniref:Uncharacterized protein n=1 Tax=Cryoendolithus antarcticus TaxID=1507870 RepID=A0A1V8SJQ2_9PEZI|nr:hypothetical protein B0A48_15106 [Cryoendolithus antarcticus]
MEELGSIAGPTVHREIPSVTAAMILTSPPRMLLISVVCLVVGILIYLALRLANKSGALGGDKANLAVLITVMGFASIVVVQHESLEWLKWLGERNRHLVHHHPLHEVEQIPGCTAREPTVISKPQEAAVAAQSSSTSHSSGRQQTRADSGTIWLNGAASPRGDQLSDGRTFATHRGTIPMEDSTLPDHQLRH